MLEVCGEEVQVEPKHRPFQYTRPLGGDKIPTKEKKGSIPSSSFIPA